MSALTEEEMLEEQAESAAVMRAVIRERICTGSFFGTVMWMHKNYGSEPLA